MPVEEILRHLRERPFVPFLIHVSDGSVYEVRHPDMVLPTARSLVIGLPANPEHGYFERAITVSTLHITRLETLGTNVPPAMNGPQS